MSYVGHDPTTETLYEADKVRGEYQDYIKNTGKWLGKPVGDFIAINPAIDQEPPTDDPNFRYVKMTAGEDGAGGYNEGVLASETITGSAPLTVVTAEIIDSESPRLGVVINLWNTENRYPKPGETAGVVANDQMQQITGDINRVIGNQNASGAFSRVTLGTLAATGSTYTSADVNFDSANSPDARTGTYTDVKHETLVYYMRIR